MLQKLDQNLIDEVFTQRQQLLESIKNSISRKLYYTTEEKIQNEKNKLQEIFDWQEGRSARLSKYSLILNGNYFEQEFLN